ncbi:Transcription and mRNA export factor eny2 [Chamberlinius hualienensis]
MSSGQHDDKITEAKMKKAIEQKLLESGEKERLKELLRSRLIECGWQDELKIRCKDIIKKKGLDTVTVDDLVQELTPVGRGERNSPIKTYLHSTLFAQYF